MQLKKLGGLASSMPFLAFIFGIAMFASIGLPGFANFASELMVFFGAFVGDINGGAHMVTVHNGPSTPGVHLDRFQVATICALWGVVMSAVYMLRAYRRVFLGEPAAVSDEATAPLSDLFGGRRWALVILMAGLLTIGFRPSLLVNLLKPAVTLLVPPADRLTVDSPASGFPVAGR